LLDAGLGSIRSGIEPEPGVFPEQTLYDESVDRQRRQGMNVLQMYEVAARPEQEQIHEKGYWQ
jgi:hypothetical protein